MRVLHVTYLLLVGTCYSMNGMDYNDPTGKLSNLFKQQEKDLLFEQQTNHIRLASIGECLKTESQDSSRDHYLETERMRAERHIAAVAIELELIRAQLQKIAEHNKK